MFMHLFHLILLNVIFLYEINLLLSFVYMPYICKLIQFCQFYFKDKMGRDNTVETSRYIGRGLVREEALRSVPVPVYNCNVEVMQSGGQDNVCVKQQSIFSIIDNRNSWMELKTKWELLVSQWILHLNQTHTK